MTLLLCLPAQAFFRLAGDLLHLVDHVLLGAPLAFHILVVRVVLLGFESFVFIGKACRVLLINIRLLHFLIIIVY